MASDPTNMAYPQFYGQSLGHGRHTQPATGTANRDPPTTAAPPYCSGLSNQGATCYLSGLLQALFHLSALREAVYRLRVGYATGGQRMALALQRLWWQMQTGGPAGVADTSELTRSFGWDPGEQFRQHDVQELLVVSIFGTLAAFFDSQTPGDNVVHRLFRGERRAQIKVPGLESTHGGPWTTFTKGETFTDIQVDIRTSAGAIRNLEDGLKYMLRPERMEGRDRYRYDPPVGGNPTWHDAVRSDMLTQLPPVLFFHLRRFGRSECGTATEKVRERFEFPSELDMAPFQHAQGELAPGAAWYDLHAVLVHAGISAGSGHYYAYVRLRGEEKEGDCPAWWRFDDSRVTAATEAQATQDNFGGLEPGGCRTAYLLMYIRRAEARHLVYKPREDVVPDFVARRQEIEDDRRRQVQEEEQRRNSCHLIICTGQLLASDKAGAAAATSLMGVADEYASCGDEKALLEAAKLTVQKQESVDQVYQAVGALLELTEAELAGLRLWVCPAAGPTRQLARGAAECAGELGCGAGPSRCTLFAEWDERVGAADTPALVILWEYHGKDATLQYSGYRVVNANGTRCGDVCHSLLSPSADSLYKAIWRISRAADGADSTLQLVRDEAALTGSVELLLCQRSGTSAELRSCEAFFLWWRRKSYTANVRPRDASADGFQLRLLRHWKREEIQTAVAEHLHRPPVCVRLWTTEMGMSGEMQEWMPYEVPRDPARERLNLWYDIIADRPEDVGEHTVMVEARDAEGHVLGKAILVLPPKRQCRVAHLLYTAQKRWPKLGPPGKLNLIEVCQHTIVSVFEPTSYHYANPWTEGDEGWAWNTESAYRVDPAPRPLPECRTVAVCHYWRPIVHKPGTGYAANIVPYGEPFRLPILPTDTAADVLKRAHRILGLCAEPAPPRAAAPQRAGVTASLVLQSGHTAAATDEEEQLQLLQAMSMSLEVPAPAEGSAPPADKMNPYAAPGDDGTTWKVAVLTKQGLFQEWNEERELGQDESVWKRVLNSLKLHKVATVGLEHAPPPAPSAPPATIGRPPSAGVVMKTDG